MDNFFIILIVIISSLYGVQCLKCYDYAEAECTKKHGALQGSDRFEDYPDCIKLKECALETESCILLVGYQLNYL